MSRKMFSYSAVIASLLATALFTGCGSSNKEGSVSPTGELASAGADTSCIQCHGSRVTDQFTGEDIMAQYDASSPHKGSTHLDGLNGCEACHGGAAQHHGVGPIQFPNPYDGNGARCAECHKGNYATNANTKFETSIHAVPYGTHTGDSCVRCHTHEGALIGNKLGLTGDKAAYSRNYYKVANAVNSTGTGTRTTAFQCSTCHEHGAGLRSVMSIYSTAAGKDTGLANWNPSKATAADAKNNQFNLCTSCHNLYNYNGSKLLVNGNTFSGVATGSVSYHDNRWFRIIGTTHYDNPNTQTVEGYNLRVAEGNACFDCHGHEAKTGTDEEENVQTIHTDWAKSSHGGEILEAKYTAAAGDETKVNEVMAVGATDASAPGWVHYNWDKTYLADGTTNDRGYCQRCHTSTGVSNFLSDPANYDESGKNNDFSHLSGWTNIAGSGQNEVLYCWGCHSNAGTGKLRNPGALSVVFDADKTASYKVTLPDAKNSNVCVACHAGRGNMNSAPVTRNGSAYHHGVAGGTLFSASTHTGFEFEGLSYANPSYFKHDKIGTDTADGTGPCVGCHMGGKSHSFKAVDATAGTIKNQALCDTCHTGDYQMTFAAIEEESAGYQNAGLLLTNMVANTVANYKAAAVTYTATGNDYKAFQNSKLTSDEKGGFVHNRVYVKRLIFDSIDWLDNGALDGTITVPADYAEARTWLGADTNTGVVAKRP